ncbi:MAG TPA: OmpH family outer membrane protein [Pyrinomonadaceae bacterium]|nr:OmpH family outer membrane protein [Pyrinomonadaceae bacterium]
MKRIFLPALFVLLAASSAAFAQGTAPAPTSKIAVIYSADFQDPKTGIARFTVAVNKLNLEFQKVQDDLSQLAQRLRQQQDEVTKLQQTPNVTPAQIQAKIDAIDLQKREYQRRGEDAQASYQKRRVELLGPLQEEVGKFLDTYARSRGIAIVLDGSQIPLLYAAESTDITKAFIAEYNSKNPATAAATPR